MFLDNAKALARLLNGAGVVPTPYGWVATDAPLTLGDCDEGDVPPEQAYGLQFIPAQHIADARWAVVHWQGDAFSLPRPEDQP